MADIYQDKGYLARLKLHTTLYCQSFSPCGKYLATCSSFGQIYIFSLAAALSPDATEEQWKPFLSFKAHEGHVYAVESTDKLLISGGTGDILAWSWSDILNKLHVCDIKCKMLNIKDRSNFDTPEINCLVIDQQESQTRLYAGCGDSKVYVWDVDSGKLLVTLKGHSDYIHCVALRSNGQDCVSSSEDGSVRIWDTRIPGEAIHILEPYKNEECHRPQQGKWVGCVAVDATDDWLVCGGGPRMSLWHMRSLSSSTIFDTPGACQQCVLFYEDSVISGGTEPLIHHWSINGDHKSQVPCTPHSVFNISINTKSENHKVLSVAGSSAKIDICTNFGYRAFCLATC